MCWIKLSNDPRYFEIDDADLPLVSQRKWHFQRYIRATFNGKIIRLHNFLLGPAPAGLEVDHRDRDVLNNKRSNLRWVTKIVNMRNRKLHKNNKSGVRGVCWSKTEGKWSAQIKVNWQMKNLGCFASLAEAAAARKKAEIELWTER